MQLMVYATYGRLGIYMIQEYCRLLGIGTSERDLRELGAALGSLPSDHPIADVFDAPRIFVSPPRWPTRCCIRGIGPIRFRSCMPGSNVAVLCFGRWVEQAPYLPQCGLVARSSHAARLAALPERAQYAAAELFRGTMTRHRFIAYGSDSVAHGQQRIQFWRRAMASTMCRCACLGPSCVRDQVPAGSVAVLWNPASGYADLILPINSAEDRLLAQIDGQRTLGEIMDARAESKARLACSQFFERLWQYDQIVFDVSRGAGEIPPAGSDLRGANAGAAVGLPSGALRAFGHGALACDAAWGIDPQNKIGLPSDVREDFSTILVTTLTLNGLIIGFSFSMAINRYEQRKNYEESEANAIGTEYSRASSVAIRGRR